MEWVGVGLEVGAAGEGLDEGSFVYVFERAADGDAEGKAADFDGVVGKELFEVEGGGISFDG